MGRHLLGLLLAVVAALGAPATFHETFDDNAHRWRMDSQWRLADGALRVTGLPGQVLAVGCEGPELGDFRAVLRARRTGGPEDSNYGFGLVYRCDNLVREGYFLALGAASGYGFGRIEGGKFALVQQGRSGLVQPAGDAPIELAVQGDRHELRIGGTLVDIWRDARRSRGGFRLLAFEQVEVAFEELRLEQIGELAPARQLGPVLPGMALEPAGAAADGVLTIGLADAEGAEEWRRHFNAMAAALGRPVLPERLDGVDVAVLALLKEYHLNGLLPPATVLADWLSLAPFQELGAVGPVATAAVEFYLQYAASPRLADAVGGQEDLLAGLTWYQAIRAAQTAAAGPGSRPWRADAALQARLDADLKRFEAAVAPAERAGRLTAWAKLGDQALDLARRLAKRP